MSDQYPKGDGALFFNTDKNPGDNRPDFRGHVVVTPDQLRQLKLMMDRGIIERDQNGAPQGMKLQIAGWRKTARSGQHYIFLGTEAFMKDEQQQGGWGGQQQAPQQQAPQQGWGAPPQQQAPQQQSGWGSPPQQQQGFRQPPQQPQQPQQGQVGFTDLEDSDVPW